jgi:hypothetical protein
VPGFEIVRAGGQTGARHSVERDGQKPVFRPLIELSFREFSRKLDGIAIGLKACFVKKA